MKTSSPDAGIPLLTEIITVPGRPEALSTPSTQAGGAADSAPGPEECEDLADAVQERALLQLQRRLDDLLGTRLQAQLSARLEAIAVQLAAQIRREVLQELQSMIVAARTGDDHADFKKE